MGELRFLCRHRIVVAILMRTVDNLYNLVSLTLRVSYDDELSKPRNMKEFLDIHVGFVLTEERNENFVPRL